MGAVPLGAEALIQSGRGQALRSILFGFWEPADLCLQRLEGALIQVERNEGVD